MGLANTEINTYHTVKEEFHSYALRFLSLPSENDL